MAPVRTCIGCRRKEAPDGLVRVTRGEDGSLATGHGGSGRGAWLCRDSPGCFDRAAQRRAFERALRGSVADTEVERLRIVLTSTSVGPPAGGSEGTVL